MSSKKPKTIRKRVGFRFKRLQLSKQSQNGQLHLTPKALANALGYSIMTMARALDELDGVGLGTIAMEGR